MPCACRSSIQFSWLVGQPELCAGVRQRADPSGFRFAASLCVQKAALKKPHGVQKNHELQREPASCHIFWRWEEHWMYGCMEQVQSTYRCRRFGSSQHQKAWIEKENDMYFRRSLYSSWSGENMPASSFYAVCWRQEFVTLLGIMGCTGTVLLAIFDAVLLGVQYIAVPGLQRTDKEKREANAIPVTRLCPRNLCAISSTFPVIGVCVHARFGVASSTDYLQKATGTSRRPPVVLISFGGIAAVLKPSEPFVAMGPESMLFNVNVRASFRHLFFTGVFVERHTAVSLIHPD